MTEAGTLRVTVNGEPRELAEGTSVAELLAQFEIDVRHVAVERNRQLVAKAAFGATRLDDGDVLEIVTLVGGG